MIMKCQSCGVTYESAYGHYNCVPVAVLSGQPPIATAPVATKPKAILPFEVIEDWNLTYNLGVAVDKIALFAFDDNLQYLEEAIMALRREMNRITGGHR